MALDLCSTTSVTFIPRVKTEYPQSSSQRAVVPLQKKSTEMERVLSNTRSHNTYGKKNEPYFLWVQGSIPTSQLTSEGIQSVVIFKEYEYLFWIITD